MPLFKSEIDNLSSYDHDKDKMFQDIQEVIFASRIILRQIYLCQVGHLLQVIMIEWNIPA